MRKRGTQNMGNVVLAAHVKKSEMIVTSSLFLDWKRDNECLYDYPLKVDKQMSHESRVSTRADTTGKPIEVGKSALVQKTCVSDAIRLWNLAPENITNCLSQSRVKIEIK